ncbi:MAG TPA: nuclear transport factor 2 family protein [Mycobacterium sp.]|nr:nuclear transport factor 2 family protein [Mycobacterium sp.]
MLSLEEISDRLELQHLLISYSEAIDRREFDELDAIFTPDAYVDYRDTGGIDGQYPQIKAWLADVLPTYFSRNAHMLGLPAIKLAGDTATARTFCFNPMVLNGDKPRIMQVGVWYDDEFVRTADGWRISRRGEIKCYDKVL